MSMLYYHISFYKRDSSGNKGSCNFMIINLVLTWSNNFLCENIFSEGFK